MVEFADDKEVINLEVVVGTIRQFVKYATPFSRCQKTIAIWSVIDLLAV